MAVDEITIDRGATSAKVENTAHLDTAHVGDILGALGTVAQHAQPPRTWTRRLLTLFAIMGPGLVVMIGDNDAGGVSTYAQAGQNYGLSLLWTLLLLVPVLIVNQEMVVRLGLVTGVGHARLIIDRFGTFWGAFSVGDLFVLNFLTIVTEFIGLSLGMQYFGISPYISVPLGAAFLIAVTVTGSFRRWERFMYVLIAFNIVLVVPLAIAGHPRWGDVAYHAVVPGIQGGLTSTALLLIIGIVGTTVAPWQLFFQQSNVVDKRLTPKWYRFEVADTVIGSVLVVIGAFALMIVCAFAFGGTKLAGQFTDAGGAAAGLAHSLGPVAGAAFAIFLLDAALIGAAAVTLATSYAFGDVFKIKHSLHRGVRDGWHFYAIYSVLVLVAAGIVLIPNAPLGLITLGVQVLAGILLPSATVFLLLLCNDRAVLGPWVNPAWLNVVAAVIIGALVELSLVLAATVLFPTFDAVLLTEICTSVLVVALLAVGATLLRRGHVDTERVPTGDRASWRMPPLAFLAAPARSRARDIGLIVLRGYLIVTAILVVIKFVQILMPHGFSN